MNMSIRFTDLHNDHWAARAIYFLAGQGIIRGMDDGTFRAENNVTIGQFCAMAALASGNEIPSPPAPAHWARNAVSFVENMGIRLRWDTPESLTDAQIDEPIMRQYAMNVAWHVVAVNSGINLNDEDISWARFP